MLIIKVQISHLKQGGMRYNHVIFYLKVKNLLTNFVHCKIKLNYKKKHGL